MVRLLPRYSIAACGGERRVRRERGKALLAQRRRDGSPRMHECSVHDDGRRCKRSFRSTQRSIRGGPTERRPFDRATESARAAAAAVPASYASQPSWSPPLLSSLLLSLLVCFAEGCQAIENVILPTQLDRRTVYGLPNNACLSLSLNNRRERTNAGRYGFRRQRQTHPGADRHITYN